MEAPKRKVTSKLSYNDHATNKVPSPYRPPSPLKPNVASSVPIMRPKAKVNSTATPASARTKVSKPMSAVSARTAVPRPASPTKSFVSASPTIGSQKPRIARTTVRPQPSHSNPGTPTPTYLSIESSDSESMSRHGSSLSVRQKSPPTGLGLSNGSLGSNSIFSPPSDELPDLPLKIKSKLSRVALTGPDSLSPSPSPSHPSSHSGHARVRAPSVSSSHSLNSTTTKPDYTLYPIASAASAGNPHRYTTSRSIEPSPSSSRIYQSFSSQDDVHPRKIDPATIPLPPHSPPTSTLSFSSRSSVSRSSVSYGESTPNTSISAHHTKSPSGGFDFRSALDTLVQINESNPRDDAISPMSPIDDDELDSDERKAKNEAKVNRKIADLEITNRSLLAINSTLEATKHRQAKEIRDLRRKLRESRLILPPRTFRAVTSNEPDALVLDDDDDLDGDDEDEDSIEADDQTYKRIRLLMDEMFESAKSALATKPADFVDAKTPTKVLSEEEVRDWNGEVMGDTSLFLDADEEEKNENLSTRASSPGGKLEGDNAEVTSEDEVEAMTIYRDSPSPPPIVVTPST